MGRKTHNQIKEFHEAIATAHVDINGFYRYNFNEIIGQLRSGVKTPALLLESHSSDLESETNMVTNFNPRAISILLLDFAGKANDFDKQDAILDKLENVALDICSYLVEQNKTRGSWLFGMFNINSFKYEKVGPIFDNMYGWNVMYTLKDHEPMKVNPDKWDF